MGTDTKTKSKYAQAAANIKRELAQAFPGIKFSTRSKSFSMGNSVDVSWEFGPTSKEVDAILDKYVEGRFDGMTDYYEYGRDEATRAFQVTNGSSKYVHGSRSLPDGLFAQICRDIAALQGVPFTSTWQRRERDSLGLDDYAHRALGRTSFPAGAQYVGVAYSEALSLTGACASDEVYKIIHTMTDEEADLRAAIRKELGYPKPCGVTVLAPDDMIVPCILPTGHQGYCATGR